MPRIAVVFVYWLTWAMLPAFAQDEWLGKQVLPKLPDTKLYSLSTAGNGRSLGIIEEYPLKVLEVRDGRLRVEHEQVMVWVAQDEMIRLEEALAYFTNRINQKQHLEDALRKRSCLYRLEGKAEEAVRDASEIIKLNPSYHNYMERGHLQLDQAKAALYYTEALRLKPNSAQAYFCRGDSYRLLKQYEEAKTDLNECIRLIPMHYTALVSRGRIWYELRDPDAAIKDFSSAIQFGSRSFNAYFYRGLARSEKGDNANAAIDFTKALEISPSFPGIYQLRGACFYSLKKYQQALEDYTKAIELRPKDAFSYHSRGLVLESMRKQNQAVEDYTKSIELEGKKSVSYDNRGSLLHSMGRHQEALKDFNHVIESQRPNIFTYYYRAKSLLALGRDKEALADAASAIQLESNSRWGYELRASIYLKQKKYKECIDDYQKIIQFSLFDAETTINLAWLLATCPDDTIRDGKKAKHYLNQMDSMVEGIKSVALFETMAAVSAETGDFDNAVKEQQQAIDLAMKEMKPVTSLKERLLHYQQKKPFRE